MVAKMIMFIGVITTPALITYALCMKKYRNTREKVGLCILYLIWAASLFRLIYKA